jgi:chromosome segregation ATPase
LEVPKKQNRRFAVGLIVVIILASFSAAFIGYWAGRMFTLGQVDELQKRLTTVQEQLDSLGMVSATTDQNQSDIQETVDSLQTQLSTIRDQLSSLQASSLDSSNEVMEDVNNIESQLLKLQEQINGIKTTMDYLPKK